MEKAFSTGNASKEEILRDAEILSLDMNIVNDFVSREDLIQFIWEERRRELCFEEAMRFWDMRRQGMPEVKHEFYSSMTSSKTFVLKQGSPNYLLPIPLSETEYNDGMTNNSRETIVGN